MSWSFRPSVCDWTGLACPLSVTSVFELSPNPFQPSAPGRLHAKPPTARERVHWAVRPPSHDPVLGCPLWPGPVGTHLAEGPAPDGNHVSRSAIRISRKGRHTLLNLCLHAALTFTAFAGGINRTKYRTLCQAVSAARGVSLYTSEGPSAPLPKGKPVVTAMKSHSSVCSAVS